METLYLGASTDNGRFDDISLSNLPALIWFQARASNRVSLSNLTNLHGLLIEGNAVSLSNLPSVTSIRVVMRPKSDEPAVLSLGTFPALYRLGIEGKLPELSLSDLPLLGRLTATGLGLTDISLSNLPLLRVLDLSGNAIEEIELSNLTNLGGIDLSRNELSSLSLAGLTQIKSLDLSENNFTGGKALSLSNLPRLDKINLEGNAVNDLSFVSGVSGLWKLLLRDNRVRNLGPLSDLPQLGELDLETNRVEDLSPLVDNPNFKGDGRRVYLFANPLSDESIDTHIPALEARGVRVHRYPSN